MPYEIAFNISLSVNHPLWNEDWKKNWCSHTKKILKSWFQPWNCVPFRSGPYPSPFECYEIQKSSFITNWATYPYSKMTQQWIEVDCNSFSCSFRWISSDSCIPKSSMINMMMSWPSLALFWPREYWMQVNVFKSSRFIYLFKLNPVN